MARKSNLTTIEMSDFVSEYKEREYSWKLKVNTECPLDYINQRKAQDYECQLIRRHFEMGVTAAEYARAPKVRDFW